MSCLNTTGPVNIIDTTNTCSETCKLSYDFQPSAISVINKGNYLSIEPVNKSLTDLTYTVNNSGQCKSGGDGKYSVQEIRLYCGNSEGSLHRYDGKRATGEIIIYLNNMIGSGNLIICIPISKSNGTLPNATSELTTIIKKALTTANSPNETSGPLNGIKLNLNNFIPKSSGFYSYTATLPYPPCSNCVNYIVYSLPDAIFLDITTITTITEIIKKYSPPIHSSNNSNIGYSYNKAGTINSVLATDGTYMDCQLVGSDGEQLIDEPKDGVSDVFLGLTPETEAKLKHILLIVSLVLLIAIILFSLMYIARQWGINWMSKNAPDIKLSE